MEVYILDDQLRRVECVDLFISFIWGERFSEKGDFILTLDRDSRFRTYFKKGTKIAIKESYKIATVDSIEKEVDESRAETIKISGYTDEHIFDNRLAKENHDNLEDNPNWELDGTPRDVMKKMVYDICIDGILSEGDIIPYLVEGDLIGAPGTWLSLPDLLYWNDAVGEWETAYTSSIEDDDPFEEVIINAKPQSLYDTLKEICDVYGLGFRLVRNFDNSELYFEIYAGQDRTSLQTYFPTVRFSVDLGNLTSSSEIDTNKDTYNVAYVYSQMGSRIVYAEGEDSLSASGFDRRVLYVEVTDYDEEQTEEEHNRLLRQRGREALAQNKPALAFDGEITKHSGYVYGVDYSLGDLVEFRSSEGTMTKMRVTEQIFVHDLEGERAYPTLTSIETIDQRSWSGLPPTLYWSMAEGYWIDWI